MPSFKPNWGNIPSKPVGGGSTPVGAKPKPVQPVDVRGGYYDDFPFDKVNYFSREAWINWPLGSPVGTYNILTQRVPNGRVLLVTSVMFRATMNAAGISHSLLAPHVLLGDAYLYSCCVFDILFNDAAPYDIRMTGGPWGVGQGFSPTTGLLNQDLLIPEIGYFLLADSGQELTCNVQLFTGPPHVLPYQLGVQVKGMWMSRTEYNRRQARND